jgi:glycerol kinase
MPKLVLAIDQGTTATTVLLIDEKLSVVAKASTEILPTYPQYGWVEHDLNKIWHGTVKTIEKVINSGGFSVGDIACIGITNQRETVGAWKKSNGEPLAPAIVWQCRRTSERCEKLKSNAELAKTVKRKTGLVLDPYFSATKIEWLRENISGLKNQSDSGSAIFGTIDTYLLFMLSCGKSFATDVSNASRTMLMDLRSLSWDKELLQLFNIPEHSLAKILPSSGKFGVTSAVGILPDGIPIMGILGDQQAALFGQLCFEPGDMKCTYGTGSFLMCNSGEDIIYSNHGLLTTVAWKMNNKVTYALEGSAFVAGAAVQFLRDNLGIIKSSDEIEAMAAQVSDSDMGELVFVPSLTGLGAPYWAPNAKGMIYGLTRGTQKNHLARAALEGIALQNNDLLIAIAEDIQPKRLSRIKVDGGASANNLLIQLQANLAGISIDRPKILDTTALGSALAAGLAAKIWDSEKDLRLAWQVDRSFSPNAGEKEMSALKSKWKSAIKRVLSE